MNSTERDLPESRLAIFAAKLNAADWTSALLAAYNPTGASEVSYETAKAALVADLVALASIRAELEEALADKARVDELLTAAVDDYDAAWKALKPFADAGGQIPIDHGPSNEPTSGDEPVTMSVAGCLIGDVTVADFERARAIAGEQNK